MTVAPDEIEDFVRMSDALLVNLGTLDADRKTSVPLAIQQAKITDKPWALDPVFVQASNERLKLAKACLNAKPTLVRSNQSEASALLQVDPSPAQLANSAKDLGSILAITGATDIITNGEISISLANGTELMDRVTAMGCALNALLVGFLAVEKDNMLAVVSAMSLFNVCGEMAATKAAGPGTFVPHFLDALAETSSHTISSKAKFS